jgi:hypothetical protein
VSVQERPIQAPWLWPILLAAAVATGVLFGMLASCSSTAPSPEVLEARTTRELLEQRVGELEVLVATSAEADREQLVEELNRTQRELHEAWTAEVVAREEQDEGDLQAAGELLGLGADGWVGVGSAVALFAVREATRRRRLRVIEDRQAEDEHALAEAATLATEAHRRATSIGNT